MGFFSDFLIVFAVSSVLAIYVFWYCFRNKILHILNFWVVFCWMSTCMSVIFADLFMHIFFLTINHFCFHHHSILQLLCSLKKLSLCYFYFQKFPYCYWLFQIYCCCTFCFIFNILIKSWNSFDLPTFYLMVVRICWLGCLEIIYSKILALYLMKNFIFFVCVWFRVGWRDIFFAFSLFLQTCICIVLASK